MKKYYIKTFWCSMNQADSEKVNMILLQSWFFRTNNIKEADLVIFNTCSVRKKWEDKVFWMIHELTDKNIWKKPVIWITGCMVRKTWLNIKYLWDDNIRNKAKKIEYLKDKSAIFNNDDKLFPRIKELDFTFRIEEVKYVPFILTHIFNEPIWKDDKYDDYLKSKQLRENKNSASIIIQTWCDNYCSFCIVPYTRWKEISRNKEEIIEEVKEAVKNWATEITLIWQNVNSYWKQWIDKNLWNEEKSKWEINNNFKSPFRELLEELDKIEWLDRIRFTSSNPHDMTKDILDAHFDLNSTCNYLHFALQSWSNEMLKRMNRKHTYEDFKKQVKYLRSKDPFFSISTDIIVGYSWETQEMFEETIKAFRECEFDFAYIARYSVREWTIASKIYPDDVPDSIKAERWHILNNILLENIEKRNSKMLWNIEKVFVIWKKDEYFYGRTRNFKEVFFDWPDSIKSWDSVNIRLKELDRYVIKWELI